MALFENFPYTNLHELNLDWLINELNKLKDTQVISVNGQTGEVILYQDAQVLLPAVDNDHWSIGRVADGTYRGIMFGNNNIAYIVHENQMSQLYAANNPPPYPVTSVNGQTGDVILYSEASVHLPSLTDAEIHKWNIWRWLNNTMSGIEFDDTGKAYLIVNANRYDIYTSNDQPPYPVTSVNGETGEVDLDIPDSFVDNPAASELTIAENIPDSSVWALLRETENGYVGIAVNNGANPAAYLQIGTGSSAQQIKLLTLADIPSSSGVVSINGLTGVVSITGANLDVSGTDTRKIDIVLSDLETNIDNIRAAFVYDENGNTTASHNIPSGSYVFWNNGAYKTSSAIAIGDTLSTTNLTAVPAGGIANELNEHIASLQGLKLKYFLISGSSSKTITFSPLSRVFIVLTGNNENLCGSIPAQSNNSSQLAWIKQNASQVTVTNNGYDMTLTNERTIATTGWILIFEGDVTV